MGGYHQLPVTPYQPQQENVLDQYARIQQLKGMQGQQQLQQQALQTGGLENQQRQLDLQSQQAMMKAYAEADGDLTKALPLAAKYGAKPADLMNLRMTGIKQQQANIELLNAKGARALQEADMMQGAYDTVAKSPVDQKPAVYQQQLQSLSNAGVDVSQMPPQYPGDQAFQMVGLGLKTHTKQMEDLAKQAGIEKDTEAAVASKANAAKTQAETEAYQKLGFAPGISAELMGMADWLKKNPGKGASDFLAWKAKQAPLAQIAVNNAAGPAVDLNDPSVQGVANGSLKLQDVLTNRTPMGQRKAFIAAVKQVNPDFNSAAYDVEKGVAKAFTSGEYSQKLNAIATAREHMKVFTDLGEKLGNGDIQALNKLKNAIGVQFGSSNVTNFNIAKQFFAGEVGKAVIQGQGTEGERNQLANDISNAGSWDQLSGALSTADKLLSGKQAALKQTYEQGRQAKPNFGESGGNSNNSGGWGSQFGGSPHQ